MAEQLSPSGKLDLSAVAGLHADLLAVSDKDVTVDLADVTLMGALCLQSCLAAARAAKDAGTDFTFLNMTDQVRAQLSAMGFSPETLMEGAA